MIKKFKKFNIIPYRVILLLGVKLKNNNRYFGNIYKNRNKNISLSPENLQDSFNNI